MAFTTQATTKIYFPQGGDRLVEDRGGAILRSVHEVAALGSNQANAPQMSGHYNFVSNANGTMGVKLPVAEEGMNIVVKNTSALGVSGLKVYPTGVGCRINALAQSGAFYLPGGSGICEFVAVSPTQWYTSL